MNDYVTQIGNDTNYHIKQIENTEIIISSKIGQKEMEETPIPVIKKSLKGTKRKVDEMKTEVKRSETDVSNRFACLEKEMRAMQNQLDKTQSDLTETRTGQSKLMKMNIALHTGQTAYNFEKDLATYIYPRGTPITFGQIFTNLMKWLETPEGRKSVGKQKWDAFSRQFNWSNKHKRVFFKMLECRRKPAHPDELDFTLPIPDNFTEDDKKYVEDIREMTVELKELLKTPNP